MPSTLITLSRLAGVIIGGPSLLANAHTMGALYVGYKGSILQISSVVSTVVAICADVVILVSTVAYLIDNNWRFFTQCSATVNILKRAYSINVVYVTVMRFRAINQGKSFPLLEKRSIVYVYMAAYTAFSVATATLQIYAYVSNNWVSAVARVSETFRLYRIFNFVTSFMYVILGVAVDTQFLLMGQSNSLHESKFTKTRAIHNHWLYIGLEVAAFAGFTVSFVWGMINPLDVTAFIYIEQLVLSYLMLNGTTLIQLLAAPSSTPFPRLTPRRSNTSSMKVASSMQVTSMHVAVSLGLTARM